MPIIHDTGYSCILCGVRKNLEWYGELVVCKRCNAFMDEETAKELDQKMLTLFDNDKNDTEVSEAEALRTPPTPEDVGIRAGDLL